MKAEDKRPKEVKKQEASTSSKLMKITHPELLTFVERIELGMSTVETAEMPYG